MPKPNDHLDLSRRERQIMHILFAEGEASAAAVREGMPDAPSDSAVRAMLTRLEAKGHVRHRREGGRYLWAPTAARGAARDTALRRLVSTFFDGSIAHAVQGLLGLESGQLKRDELEALAQVVARAREQEDDDRSDRDDEEVTP